MRYKNYSDFLQMHVDLVRQSPSGACTKAALKMARTSIQVRELSMNLRSRMRQKPVFIGIDFAKPDTDMTVICDDYGVYHYLEDDYE